MPGHFPLPLQIHVVWHPDSDTRCRPIAETIYKRINRDPTNPLLPSLGIPVFFRCAGADPADPKSRPAPIAPLDETELDLRIFLMTADYFFGPSTTPNDEWVSYRDESRAEVRANRHKALMVEFGLDENAVGGAALGLQIDKDDDAEDFVLGNTLLQACRLLSGRQDAGANNSGAAALRFVSPATQKGTKTVAGLLNA